MKLIRKENGQLITENDLHQFLLDTFKNGTVPKDIKEFRKCFANNTTDGSLCFANQFGKGEDDASMMFFYPYHCQIPPKYNKNLKNQEYCNISLVVLEYQLHLAKVAGDVEYLKELRQQVKIRHSNTLTFMRYDLFKYTHLPVEDEDLEEFYRGFSQAEIKESIEKYSLRYKQVVRFLDRKIFKMTANASGNIQENVVENDFFDITSEEIESE